MKDRIIKFIEDAGDAFGNQIQRNVAVRSVASLFDEENEKCNFIREVEEVDKYIDISEIIHRCDEGFIYKQRERRNDDCTKKYHLRVVLKDDKRGCILLPTVCENIDSAMILYIANKNNCPDMVDATLKLLNTQVRKL